MRNQCLSVTENTELDKERELIDMVKLGKIIKKHRTWKTRLPLLRFATYAASHYQTVYNVEEGNTKHVSLRTIDKIARGLGMKLSELIALVEE